jgi:hypothetical protein
MNKNASFSVNGSGKGFALKQLSTRTEHVLIENNSQYLKKN